MNRAPALGFLLAWLVAGCGDREVPAAELGERSFADPGLSTSPFNRFSCATCHAADAAAPVVIPGRLDSGYNLGNSAGRGSWWGTYELRLLDAANTCLSDFMGGRKLAPDEDAARQLGAFLDARSPAGRSDPAPLSIVRIVTSLQGLRGDQVRGKQAWQQACARCHGAPHTGSGRLGIRPTVVPEDTLRSFPDNARAVVVEKIRHGRYFNIGGVMPFYSLEVLTDLQVADLLAYLGL